MVALSLGGVAALIAAVVWGLLVLFLAYVMINLVRILESVKYLVDGIRQETVPLLSEVTTTVRSVNRELDRADGLLQSAGNIAKSVERLSTVIEHTVSSPLIKVAAFAAGAGRAVSRFRKDR